MNSQIEALNELNNQEYKNSRKNSSKQSRFSCLLTYGCAIVDTGSQLGYSFDSYHGKCAVIENNIGFEDDSKTEGKFFY